MYNEKNREALIKGVKRVKESVIKQMENSDSRAEIYTASNYRLAEVTRGIENAKNGFLNMPYRE